MKKISLFAILLAAVAMTACTDYREQINEAHDEYWGRVDNLYNNSSSSYDISIFFPNSSSAAEGNFHSIPCGDIWCGPGAPHSRAYDVQWFNYFDSLGAFIVYVGGQIGDSKAVELGYDVNFTSLADMYGMIGGSFGLSEVNNVSSYASVVANIGNPDIGLYYDVSLQNGICVVYSSSSPLKLMLSFYNEKEECDYDRPMVVLPPTTEEDPLLIDFMWGSFQQEGWSGKNVSAWTAVSKLVGFDFQFSSTYSEHKGDFKIYSIGFMGSCSNYY